MTFLPVPEVCVEADLNAVGEAIGNAWNTKAAIDFNTRMNVVANRERLQKNILFLMQHHGITTDKPDVAAKALAEFCDLSESSATHVLAGVGTFVQTCVVCTKLGVGLGTMLEHDVETEPLLTRLLKQKQA